jgi:hypothetical protein
MRRTAIATLVCGLVFGIAATWLGPKMIAYWYSPPVPNAFNCTDAVGWAMHRLIWTQLIGTAIGLLVGLVLGILMRGKKPPPAPATVPATQPAAPTPKL